MIKYFVRREGERERDRERESATTVAATASESNGINSHQADRHNKMTGRNHFTFLLLLLLLNHRIIINAKPSSALRGMDKLTGLLIYVIMTGQ